MRLAIYILYVISYIYIDELYILYVMSYIYRILELITCCYTARERAAAHATQAQRHASRQLQLCTKRARSQSVVQVANAMSNTHTDTRL